MNHARFAHPLDRLIFEAEVKKLADYAKHELVAMCSMVPERNVEDIVCFQPVDHVLDSRPPVSELAISIIVLSERMLRRPKARNIY